MCILPSLLASLLPCRHIESEKRLPKACLVMLCKFEPLLCWTRDCDNVLYQTLVEILIPEVLRPIPSKSSATRIRITQDHATHSSRYGC